MVNDRVGARERLREFVPMAQLAVEMAKIQVPDGTIELRVAAKRPDGSGSSVASFEFAEFLADIDLLTQRDVLSLAAMVHARKGTMETDALMALMDELEKLLPKGHPERVETYEQGVLALGTAAFNEGVDELIRREATSACPPVEKESA